MIPTPDTFPTIHLNGTSKEQLLREYEAAANACQEALDAACKVTVHGRDYYVQPRTPASTAYEKARDAHDKVLLALSEAQNHFAAIMANIQYGQE